jgi:hypothetical protein
MTAAFVGSTCLRYGETHNQMRLAPGVDEAYLLPYGHDVN